MLFQSQSEIELVHFSRILAYIIVICFLVLMGVLFYLKSLNKEKKLKSYFISLSSGMILYAISRFGEFLGSLYFYFNTLEDFRILFWYIGSIFAALALFAFLFSIEWFVLEKRTKFIFSLVQATLFILALILGPHGPKETALGKSFLYASSFPALIIPIIYFYIGYQTSGETRKRSISAGLGFMCFFIGIIFNTKLGDIIAIALWGYFLGNLVVTFIFSIFIPLGLIIFYKSLNY